MTTFKQFVSEKVSQTESDEHLLARVQKVLDVVGPLKEHPLVFRAFRHLTGENSVLLKVVNDREDFKAKSGDNKRQEELIKALGIKRPVFCNMVPSTGWSAHGTGYIFIPSKDYEIKWSPIVKDIGGMDIVGKDASKYGRVTKGNVSTWNYDKKRMVGDQFADTYLDGWPKEHTDNELIFDCDYYYLLDIKQFVTLFAGIENKDIVSKSPTRTGFSAIDIFNADKFKTNFKTYGDITKYLRSFPEYLKAKS